ncbi:hypothetical protein BH23GEM6_BH23GEM6_27870 [soil metagenome]
MHCPVALRYHHLCLVQFLVIAVLSGCAAAIQPSHSDADTATHRASPDVPLPDFLYVWATAVDTIASEPIAPDTLARRRRRGVLLLTIDLRDGSSTRGQVTRVLLVDSTGRSAHHTEHALAPDGYLFANDFGTGRTHVFDLRSSGDPRGAGSFTTAGPFAYPHSFVQLPNGNVLATYQWQGLRQPPGGLAELRRDGTVVRWAHAAAPGVDSTLIQPYSLEVLPPLDRVVTTSTSMTDDSGLHVQVWRLSDLALLHTLEVPRAPGHGDHTDDGEHGSAAHGAAHHLLPERTTCFAGWSHRDAGYLYLRPVPHCRPRNGTTASRFLLRLPW